MSEEENQFQKSMDKIRSILDVIEGKIDFKKRVEILLKPDAPQTSSKLTIPQVRFVQTAYWIADIYPEFECLKNYAEQLLKTQLSHDGFGIKSTIDLQKALTHGEKESVMIKETLPEKIKRSIKGEEKTQ